MFGRWVEAAWTEKFSAPGVHIVFGARQTGKSTLLRRLLPEAAVWLDFSRPAARSEYERSLADPQFAPVVPDPDLGSVPIAIIVPSGEAALLAAMNAAIEAGSADGMFKEKLDYWVHGKGTQLETGPRWSVGRDVLGWWQE